MKIGLSFHLAVLLIVVLGAASYSADGESSSDVQDSERLVVIIRGASGTDEYGEMFDSWSARWVKAAETGKTEALRIGPVGPNNSALRLPGTSGPADADWKQVKQTLRDAAAKAQAKRLTELWIVLIGHGTFDGRSARFNLRGQDVSAEELKKWLEPITCPIAIANCSSASGPFLKALAGQNRVVMTATKTGAGRRDNKE